MRHAKVIDPRTNAQVWVAGGRQARPNLPSSACPFCPGGLEAPEPYDVRVFRNRWPALPDDRCEVILYTPDHDATFASLGLRGARLVVDAWADRSEALGARDDVAAVLPFENRGPEVGATIAHPHGQVYAFEDVPPALVEEFAGSTCHLCQAPPDDLVVAETGGWRAAIPEAARYPFELVIAPLDHRADLVSLTTAERDGLAATLLDVLGRLDRVFGAPMPYMLWVHQRPTDGGEWPAAHVHVDVVGLHREPSTPRYVAAGELGSGVWFNPVAPQDAARRLREA
jgi:UDPglucose--hexose-1-phosphate uridylyltransferase